jgi:hypothetical protein
MTNSAIASPYALIQAPGSTPASGNHSASDRSTKAQARQIVGSAVLAALGVNKAAHGVRGIAHAIRDALASADPNAPDPVPGLLQTINDALDSAAKTLADQGIDQTTVDATIKRFRSDLASALDSQAPSSTDATAISPATTAVAARDVVREKVAINILTTEGDQVSIRFRTQDVVNVSSAQATGQATDNSGTATALNAHVISRGRLKIEVVGNLSDGELTAIGDLLDKVDAVATQFFGGDLQAAFAAASNIGLDSSQIASFSLQLTYSRRVAFATTGANAPASTAPPADSTATTPAAQPQTQPPPTTQVAPATSDTTASASADATTASTPAIPAPAPAPSAQQTITIFIKDVLSQLASVSDSGTVRFTMRWKVDFLLTALSTLAPAPDAAPAASTNVLSDTLHNAIA